MFTAIAATTAVVLVLAAGFMLGMPCEEEAADGMVVSFFGLLLLAAGQAVLIWGVNQ